MAQSKSVKQSRPKTHSFVRKHKIITVLMAVVLLAAAGFQVWHVLQQRAIQAEKARFAQAERDIDSLTSQIVATIGQPLRVDKTKYCSRPHLKLQKGPLSCDVGTTAYYTAASSASANTTTNNVRAIIGTKWSSISEKASNNMAPGNLFQPLSTPYNHQLDYQQLADSYFTELSHLRCTTSALYYKSTAPPYSNFFREDGAEDVLAYDLNCSGSAKIQHYPLRS